MTQPLITRLENVKSASTSHSISEHTGQITLESGIRIGLLFDLVERHMISCSPASSALLGHIILDEEQIKDVPGRWNMNHHLTLHQSYTIQYAIGTVGRAFREKNVPDLSPRDTQRRRIPPAIER